MRFRTWPVVAVALTGLLLLIVASVVATRNKAQAIYSQLDELNDRHRQVDSRLRRLRGDVHVSGIFVRDYLLDTSREDAAEYRERLAQIRQTSMRTLSELAALVGPDEDQRIRNLRTNLTDYWEGLEPLLGWTVAQKLAQSPAFLRREVLPRRNAVVAMADEIEALNNDSLSRQRHQIAGNQRELRRYLDVVLWVSTLVGVLVAVAAVIRIRLLERRSEEQRLRTAAAESDMRQLSHQLVKAQEAERKSLSRELHDHVGQMLTALRMELGTAERAPRHGRPPVRPVDHRVEAPVRDDAADGARPRDGPAPEHAGRLRPQARTRMAGARRRAPLRPPGRPDRRRRAGAAADAHRTCIYRVVQEALTNCVRHARASRVSVTVVGRPASLELRVEDDGVGFAPAARPAGLGLLGLDERVRELRGDLTIDSRPGHGTRLRLTMPVPVTTPEEAVLAHPAG